MKYDVIIAGTNFAGLAIASKIKGNILLIDRHAIGSCQTSACATEKKIIVDLNCENSILQSFKKVAIHTHNKIYDIGIISDHCTIDYQKFCEEINSKNSAEFLQTTIEGYKNNEVITHDGTFSADVIIDATGSRATIASSIMPNYSNLSMVSSGVETEVKYKKDEKLRFFIDEKRKNNSVAWIFPINDKARFGVASYGKDPALLKKLKQFVEEENNLKLEEVHGGYFSYGFRKPIVEDIFVVGDAAGQTLPLTGEGIRRIIKISLFLGDLIQQYLNKKISKADALKMYEKEIYKTKKQYELLLKLQSKLPIYKNWHINIASKLLSLKPFFHYAWKRYEKI